MISKGNKSGKWPFKEVEVDNYYLEEGSYQGEKCDDFLF